MWSTISFEHVLLISGCFVKTGTGFVVLNVYAPCDLYRQQTLWNALSIRLGTLSDYNVCVCGHFNAVQCREERRSVGGAFNAVWSDNFNNLID